VFYICDAPLSVSITASSTSGACSYVKSTGTPLFSFGEESITFWLENDSYRSPSWLGLFLVTGLSGAASSNDETECEESFCMTYSAVHIFSGSSCCLEVRRELEGDGGNTVWERFPRMSESVLYRLFYEWDRDGEACTIRSGYSETSSVPNWFDASESARFWEERFNLPSTQQWKHSLTRSSSSLSFFRSI